MVETQLQGAANPAPSFHIRRVKTKLAMGQYSLEDVSCFCGKNDHHVVTEKDRYGFNHRMVLCKSCGLIYATPRMTEDSYRKFYENEYRPIYDWGCMDTEQDFKAGISGATNLLELLNELDIYPRTVFDIGCNSGAWLKPFQDVGCEVYGVDYGLERIQYGKSQGLNISQGSIEELEATGKKADLIILSHVLEHCLDLKQTLKRIGGLLTDNGVLFISTPSLFTWKLDTLFQNAHPYLFTARTLDYVMSSCGFEDVYLNEGILSLWRKSEKEDKFASGGEVRHILNFLSGRNIVPEIRTVNKFPLKDRKVNIRAALKTQLPDMGVLIGSLIDTDAIIIGGGPSVSGYSDKIKTMQAAGMKVIAIERMYQWCLSNDIIPDYVVVMDAADDVIESFTTIRADVIHLVATQCKQDVYDILSNYCTYIFNTPQKGISMADLWDEHNYDNVTQINSGGSVVLCALSIAMTLGSRNIHIFGFDCHITEGVYAKGITGNGAKNDCLEVEIDGRIFKTRADYISFMQQFFQLIGLAKKLNMIESVKIYGDSMVAFASKDNITGGLRYGQVISNK